MPLGSPGGEQAPLGNGIAPADLEESFLGMYSFSLQEAKKPERGQAGGWEERELGIDKVFCWYKERV